MCWPPLASGGEHFFQMRNFSELKLKTALFYQSPYEDISANYILISYNTEMLDFGK